MAGLRGKTIGVNALANVATLIVSSVLAGNDIPPTAVRFVAIPFPQMGEALAARRIDAAWLVEPFLTEAEIKSGAEVIADGDQGATANFPVSGYVVTTAWARRYPGTAAAFVRALSRGQQLADTSRPAVEQVLPHYLGVTRQVASLVVTGDFPVGVNRMHIQRVADIMHQFGMLPSPSGVAPMIAPEAIETRYTGPGQWWAASWSQAPRIAWQHIRPCQRKAARTAAFGLLRALRDQNGGTLTRRPIIGYTTARTPISPPPEGPAQ